MKGVIGMYAETLRRSRETAELSQKDVANALGISQFAVSKWERGEMTPTIERLKQLADLYNTSIDALVGHERA